MNATYAPATLERWGRNWIWVVTSCPNCGERHSHGGGIVGKDNPDNFLSHRAGHGCEGYILMRDPQAAHADTAGEHARPPRKERSSCTR